MNNRILDLNTYLARMEKGMDDKLWWVAKTDCKRIVDFGCADGALLKHLHAIDPSYELVGVDIDSEMCRRAKENVPEARILTLVEFMDSDEDWSDAILILSSVVHEIYSYEIDPEDEVQALYSKGFKHIAIRDMFLSESVINCRATYHDYSNVVNYSDENQLRDFERLWGPVGTIGNMCHFLLKYRYKENWNRECCENYLPIPIEVFLRNVPKTYVPVHIEHYSHPYIREHVWNDFYIRFNERTHAKILLTRV